MKAFLLIFLFIINSAFLLQQKPGSLWQDGFELYEWKKNWKISETGSWGMENAEVERGHNTSQFLRVNFPERSINKGRKFLTAGIHFISEIPESDSLYLRYYIRFGQSFPIKNSIVLPGIAVDNKNHNSQSSFNVKVGPDGKPGISYQSSAGMINYTASKAFVLGKNQWYCIEQKIKLNNAGFNNGELKLWIDGILVLEKSSLKLSTIPNQKLNAIDFSAFIENNYNSSIIEQQTNVDFDSFVVSNNINSCAR